MSAQKMHRADRLRPDPAEDQRNAFEHDRDRILYSDVFRRLQGVTQVVSPIEGHVFHNRLTHSIKVAQLARRIAQNLVKSHEQDQITALGGIDPEVAEAAALAHDLGHPPFGHIAEETLATLVRDSGVDDQYEGNAQTFRILTKLEKRWDDAPGMNLTRATLNAVIKYPWYRQVTGKKSKKYGAYQTTEQAEFRFARGQESPSSERRSCEAEIMDWSDDITFSVHDTEDFFRAGLIPLDRLSHDTEARGKFLARVKQRWTDQGRAEVGNWSDYEGAFLRIAEWMNCFSEPYDDSQEHQALLRHFSSSRIRNYVAAITLYDGTDVNESRVRISPEMKQEVTILKELTWEYVILRPALATQQYGHQTAIEHLFTFFCEALMNGESRRLPARFRGMVKGSSKMDEKDAARSSADVVSGLTDSEALRLYRTLNGVDPGSVLLGPR